MRDLGTALLNELDSIEKHTHLLLNQQASHPSSISFVEVSTNSIENSFSVVVSLIRLLYVEAPQIDKIFEENTIKGESIVNTFVLNLLSRLLFNLILLNNKNLDTIVPIMDKVFNVDEYSLYNKTEKEYCLIHKKHQAIVFERGLANPF